MREMDGDKIIVIGSPAGGLKALTAIAGQLPADLDAAVFIVQLATRQIGEAAGPAP